MGVRHSINANSREYPVDGLVSEQPEMAEVVPGQSTLSVTLAPVGDESICKCRKLQRVTLTLRLFDPNSTVRHLNFLIRTIKAVT